MKKTENQERVMGVHVLERELFGTPILELRPVPEEVLAEITRHKLAPILTLREVLERGREFVTLGNFAVKSRRNSLEDREGAR